ncbi:MAG TPA: MraY family glycosyltransferase [Syntrophorhabdaceae bacterium]|nr:MraY family glycosyltransferase [Syntrophorhabdaceae bacterium]
MIYLTTLLLSLFLTITLIPFSIRIAEKVKALDIPDERKVHTVPIPRIGGIAMAVGTFVSMLLWASQNNFLRGYAIGAGIIVLFGIIDDLKDLGYKAKFSGQMIATLVVIFYGGLKITNLGMLLPDNVTLPEWVSIPLTLVFIVGVTNAINLADGLDGLAGGICLLSFCCIGYLAFLEDNTIIALLSLSIVGAIFGFLRFNTYPASLFMGDTGSQFLGFSLVTTSIALTQGDTALSPVLPLIIFGFPVLDTVTVMFERVSERRPLFSPDKNHFHHRLIGLRLYHTEAVLIIYIIQAVLVTSAFVFRFYSDWVLLIGYAIFATMILTAFFMADRTGFVLRRQGIVDTEIKGRLKVLKEKGIFIIVFFRIVEFGVPLLLFLTCFIPRTVPKIFGIFSAGLIVFIVAIWFLKKPWLRSVLTVTIYLLIPLTVYLSTADARISKDLLHLPALYDAAFVFLLIFVILTLRFTRRKRGFKATPMDFLIFFIALVAPYIAGTYTEYKQIGAVAAKTIMLFFSYEVLMGELRGQFNRLTFSTICSLLVISARGFLGG